MLRDRMEEHQVVLLTQQPVLEDQVQVLRLPLTLEVEVVMVRPSLQALTLLVRLQIFMEAEGRGGENVVMGSFFHSNASLPHQLDPLLRATGSAGGDVNDPATGRSPYPGNINQLVFAMEPYVATLHRTRGAMPEFVNPKYADAAKMAFKKPTRLECMMQDYPKLLGPEAKVRFVCAMGGSA